MCYQKLMPRSGARANSSSAQDLQKGDERMERKPILMPPSLIRRVDALAAKASQEERRTVSFAEIVRRALEAYDPAAVEEEEDAALEALAEALIGSNQETIAYLDEVERKLDETHAQLEKHKHGLERQGR